MSDFSRRAALRNPYMTISHSS